MDAHIHAPTCIYACKSITHKIGNETGELVINNFKEPESIQITLSGERNPNIEQKSSVSSFIITESPSKVYSNYQSQKISPQKIESVAVNENL